MKVSEINCKTAIGNCGFEEGAFCINPYLGCQHNCQYCYARFMKRFTGMKEEWGTFVCAKKNIAEVLRKQMKSKKYRNKLIFIGTVTDPYQPIEKKYKLTRSVLEIILEYQNPVEILTKSDLILKDIDLIKKFRNICINFTINTLDEKWKKFVEPNSSSIKERFDALKKLKEEGVKTSVLMGPYWPVFTEPEKLFEKFKEAGVKRVFTESLNTIGGNWIGVEKILKNNYPKIYSEIRDIVFNKTKFDKGNHVKVGNSLYLHVSNPVKKLQTHEGNNVNEFYAEAEKKVLKASKEYNIPVTIFFARGHAKNEYK